MNTPRIIFLGETDYADSLQWMQAFTEQREAGDKDEFWVLNHAAVYTQGTSCDALPAPPFDMIPVVKSDRGGQITYHGKGQLIIYLLLDIKRLGIGPKKLVKRIERALMALLAKHKIVANTRPGAPGVYVDARKIAALGLRIKRGMTYHGLSLNIDMDLAPFNGIDPCGYAGLEVTQLADLLDKVQPKHITDQLIDCLIASIYSSTEGET